MSTKLLNFFYKDPIEIISLLPIKVVLCFSFFSPPFPLPNLLVVCCTNSNPPIVF